jgi:hypothetical protein
MRSTTYRQETAHRGRVHDTPRQHPQLALCSKMLHLASRYTDALSRLRDRK